MPSPSPRLTQLENLAKENLIRLVYSKSLSRGGICRIKGNPAIFLARSMNTNEKVELIAEALHLFCPGLEVPNLKEEVFLPS